MGPTLERIRYCRQRTCLFINFLAGFAIVCEAPFLKGLCDACRLRIHFSCISAPKYHYVRLALATVWYPESLCQKCSLCLRADGMNIIDESHFFLLKKYFICYAFFPVVSFVFVKFCYMYIKNIWRRKCFGVCYSNFRVEGLFVVQHRTYIPAMWRFQVTLYWHY